LGLLVAILLLVLGRPKLFSTDIAAPSGISAFPIGQQSLRCWVRYRDENGQGWADIIDLLTMYPDAAEGRQNVG
jgi:hypothetical protein